MSGYQYAQIHAAGTLDPNSPYLGGSRECPAFDNSAAKYANTAEFASTENASKSFYRKLGGALLGDVLPEDAWDYLNAYAIWVRTWTCEDGWVYTTADCCVIGFVGLSQLPEHA